MKFSVLFFSSVADESTRGKYDLLVQVARLADAGCFTGIWTPERHFHAFGGLFPNPAVTNAALATITERIQLRAGSLIAPLHHTIRVAEDWSMIDNLSKGRVAVSFGTGWNVNDFVLFPERFADRRKVMYEQIDMIQRLWKGQRVTLKNTFGKDVDIELFPRPVQSALPVWITSSGNVATFIQAGRMQANILTHLAGQSLTQLKDKIGRYRLASEQRGIPRPPLTASLMVHTFLDDSEALALSKARPALRSYLKSAIELEYRAAAGGGPMSGGRRAPTTQDEIYLTEELLDLTVDRYINGQSIIGTANSVMQSIDQFKSAGVDELACLIDFGLSDNDVLLSVKRLSSLASSYVKQ